MTNSTGNFNVKETPRGLKQRPGDCVVAPTHNLEQISEFKKWLEEVGCAEYEEMLLLGWTFGYDILPDNLKKYFDAKRGSYIQKTALSE